MIKTPKVYQTRTAFTLKRREHLMSMRAALRREAASIDQAGPSSSTDGAMDSGDLASKELEQHMTVILSERERDRINKIDDALKRLDDTNYGVCESCAQAIAKERLKAVPFTKRCRDCQEDQEREERTRYHTIGIEGRRLREFDAASEEDGVN